MVIDAWPSFQMERFESYLSSINLHRDTAKERDKARRDLIALDIRATVEWLHDVFDTSNSRTAPTYGQKQQAVLEQLKKFLAHKVFPAFIKREVDSMNAYEKAFIKCHENLKEFVPERYVKNRSTTRRLYPGCPVNFVVSRRAINSYKVRIIF
jgi:DNA relaxase NicK